MASPCSERMKAFHNGYGNLLEKERTRGLTAEEREELDFYEALDDYLSLLNRLARNTFIYPAN